MSVRSIVRYPHPALRTAAQAVAVFDEALRTLAQDLHDTMLTVDGVGITAPHIGVGQRVVVLALPDDPAPRHYVNPVIIWRADDLIVHDEGSVSMPGVVEKVSRAAKVRVRYQDLDGVEQIEEADGFRAVCHQHEIDQLDGVFWVERLSRLKRDRAIARFNKLLRAGTAAE
ncbi:peptide deformylase [Robbsia sp. KACC 23696]|uniref:peptide deformylase n=1 Tax=Robbsia sp. KACC 23696 TaxID=3149231 RepID=UPI00325C1856